MTNAPPQGSPGAPHLSYSNPTSGTMPRRSSYASVAAGTAGAPHQNPSPSVHLPRTVNPPYPQYAITEHPSRIPQPVSDPDAQLEGGISIPSSWGRGGNNMSSYTSPRLPSYPGDKGQASFFKPSYLSESKYMEKLEAAHKAKLAFQREEFTLPLKSGSLSTSSSSVSLHKMAPSHRGMTYEIIENHPPVEDDTPSPLPSKWAEVDNWGGLEILSDGQEVKYVNTTKTPDHEAAAARTDHPMPPQCGLYYFEVYIASKGKEGMIGVGFSGRKASLGKLPGWENDSWGYHGDDGKSFCCQSTGKDYGPKFSTGDIIGCGVNFVTGCAFFTKNGHMLSIAFKDLKSIDLYPSVGMKRPYAQVSVNLGQRPFVYDIDNHMMDEKRNILNEIDYVDVSILHPTLDEDELCKALVAQYLSHDGYDETARAFAEEVRAGRRALRGSPASPLDGYLAIDSDRDATNRQRIRTAILDSGDMDEAIRLTNINYPNVLIRNRDIDFQLKCRKFVELMRQYSEMLDNPNEKRNKSIIDYPAGKRLNDGFELDMDLDEPLKDGEDWDKMDTEESDNNMKPNDLLREAISYGKELREEFKGNKSEAVTEALHDVYSMFAYEDPRKAPNAHILETSQRTPVAEGLNSAILVSLGRSPSTALERLYKQTVVLIDMISENGGPGSFINPRSILKRGGL